MRIRTLETPELGNRTYVVDDGTVSVVLDPQRDLDRLEPMLEHDVTHVLETHVHNDYVTGGLELARRTGAAYGVNAADPVAFERLPLDDGEVLAAGRLEVRVLATPGHTPTHLSYVVRDTGEPEEPAAVFSGGSLLFGTVGRTDLVAPELTHELARAQHASARRLGALAGSTLLLPTHGFGSFCAAGGSSVATGPTIADQLDANDALTEDDAEAFAAALVASFGAHPSYYAQMAPLNRAGPGAPDLASLRPAAAEEVAGLLHAGAHVVDIRAGRDFAAGFRPGSINVALGAQLATYVGWVLPWGEPLVVVAEQEDHLDDARRQLARIGIDHARYAPVAALPADDAGPRSYRQASFAELARERRPGDVVLDVRRAEEHRAAHLPGAVNIPVHEVLARSDELPAGARVWVHCAAGYRSGIAASLLDRADVEVVQVDDTFDAAAALGLTG